jgi:hypothetical protein
VAVSKAGILDFLHTYPSLIVSAQEKVADAKKRVIDADPVLLPIAEKKLREAESAVNILRIQHDEYHRLLGHFSELQDEDVRYALDFLISYAPQWAEARNKEITAEKLLGEIKANSMSRADMVEDFRKRFVEAKIKRETLEKKAFAMSELLRYANHR